MLGIDVHPVYQFLLDFVQVKREGYDAVFVKVSEGRFYIPKGLRLFVRRIRKQQFPVMGYYHFLTNAKPEAQARNFAKRVKSLGGPENRVLIVDFENYGSKTASNTDLKRFVAEVKRIFPGKKVLLYSGYGFWTGGTPSGDASQYGVDGLWDARYADLNKHDNPRAYWGLIKSWYWRQPRWGGQPPPELYATQYTSTGRVAGKYVDVNVFHADLDSLKKLAK